MAKKQNTPPNRPQQQPAGRPVAAPKQPVQRAAAVPVDTDSSKGFAGKYTDMVLAGVIALVTYLFLLPCMDNKLTNWDDLGYVITNPLIKNQTSEGLSKIFSFGNPLAATVMGNYHPLTIALYWWEYGKVGLEPWLYHFDSVLFHLLVTLAVYGFVKVMTRRTVAAAVAALLFGLHPMHIESVAWVAGRKDLIYGFFFVLAMTTYLFYVRSERKKIMWYVVTLLLFALSLMAKSVGVTLPVVLLLLDYFENRPVAWKDLFKNGNLTSKGTLIMIADKVPFLALSILFGVLSIKAQADIGALGTLDVNFTGIERFALGFYALTTYLWKAIVPVGMTNFYPYPIKEGSLAGVYYVYPMLILALGIALLWFGRKNKIVMFGFAFLVVNLLLLLQFIPVGGAIFSDRYSYIPYLGLFLIAGWFVSNYFESREKQGTGKIVLAATVIYCLVLGGLSNARAKDWYDSVSLWKDNIEKHPTSPVGYFYLGQEYYSRFETAKTPQERQALGDSAFFYFTKSVERKPDYINPIVCIGEYQRSTGQIEAAKKTYLRGMEIDPKNESVYLGLGVVYAIQQKFDSSEAAFRKAVSLKDYYPEGQSNFANFFYITGKTDSALAHYAIAIAQNPDAYIPYMNRGNIYMKQQRWKDALADFDRATLIRPEAGEPFYNRGACYMQLGNQAKANEDIARAKALGYAPK
ncbi:MAG: tetratricopeptide repeat protein [Bacteroidota bacterium]